MAGGNTSSLPGSVEAWFEWYGISPFSKLDGFLILCQRGIDNKKEKERERDA